MPAWCCALQLRILGCCNSFSVTDPGYVCACIYNLRSASFAVRIPEAGQPLTEISLLAISCCRHAAPPPSNSLDGGIDNGGGFASKVSMERRGLALERSWRRRKARISAQSGNTPPAPPPPPPVDPPPSGSSAKRKPQKRSTYGLQRDYRVLEREKKVTAVLENHGFRTELENILQGQLEGRERPATRPPPDQWQVDLHQRASNQGTRQPVAVGDGMAPVVPINDLGGILASKYTLAERETRCKLAAVYRLVDMFGWTQLIHNHITVSYKLQWDVCAHHTKGSWLFKMPTSKWHSEWMNNHSGRHF